MLAPRLFPIWDRTIAKAYELTLDKAGSNGERYWRFMLISQRQCFELRRDDPDCKNPLKSIDEYKAGKDKAFNALVGQVMKASQGKANPGQVNELLKKKLVR